MFIWKRLLWASPLTVAAILFISPVYAQNAADEDDEDAVEEITVTGSRIKRDAYSSPSPIQVLDVEAGRKIGISSISDLLQRATVSSGQQIDASINTGSGNANATEAPATGGVGSNSIDLRGLGPERTLVMLNGRRLGSNGVRGAPAQPDIAMIPFALVERVEILTEGVSAVYGADAVAGVVNVILRDEFEGLEFLINSEQPQHDGGDIQQISMIAGVVSERGSIQFAAEVFDRTRIRTGDRNFSKCFRDIDVREDGSIESICRSGFFDNNGFRSDFSLAFYTPGSTNIGVPNWSNGDALPWNPSNPLVADPAIAGATEDRFPFIDFYNDQDERRHADLVGELERFSLVTTGKLSLDFWANEEIFFESMYLNNKVFSIAGTEQIFPDLLGTIPQEDANGNIIVDATGAPIRVDNPLNPFPDDFTPIITLDSIPQTRDVEREQSRFVLGLRGDFGESSWSYETYASYDRGIGFQAQPILIEPHFQLAIHNIRLNAAGDVICGVSGNTSTVGFGFITAEQCVPWDFNNADLFTGGPTGEGVFTAEEENFFIGNRTNRTVVEQEVASAFATGDLFDIGGRTVAAAIGVEYRKDTIASQNDVIGVLALNAAESPLQEGETIGARHLFEVFGEIAIPVLDTVDLDAALRFTDEENFGSEITWRARLAWQPTDYLTLSGTFGTSFRAPNLREQFLADQFGGVSGSLDPCIFANISQLVGNNGDADPQVQLVINNCIASGVQFSDSDGNGLLDTTPLGSSGVTTIPVSTGGNATLKAETSDTTTFTVKFAQPWFDSFDLDLAVSYFNIEIEDTVSQPDAGFILNGCFGDSDFPNGTSGFCDLLTRLSSVNGQSDFINFIDVSFINIGEETAEGLDFNTRLSFSLLDAKVDVIWSTVASYLLEREIETFSAADRDDNVGEIGFAEWKVTSTLGVHYNDWEFLMQNRYISSGQEDNTDVLTPGAGLFSADGIGSRDLDSIPAVWYTDVSLTFAQDTWSATLGITNLADKEPPLIHSFEGPNRNNAVSSAGYDFFGRTWFASVALGFGT